MMGWFQGITEAEEHAIAAFMQQLSMMRPAAGPAVEDARRLWLRGQLLRRWEAERRVHLPLDIVDGLQLAGGLAAAVMILVWSLPLLMN